MAYDFETVIDRTGTGAAKWEEMREANPDVPPGISPFSVADLDLAIAPEIIDGLREHLRTAVLGYTIATDDYWDAVTGWFQRRHGWTVDREQISLAPGIVPAFFTAIRAFTEQGDGVIVQTPAYYPFYRGILSNGRTVVGNPLVLRDGRWRLDLEDLEAKAKDPRNKVLLFCSPHNPTGRVWERDELEAVARIALENDLIVISDEIHFDLVLPGSTHTVFSTLSPEIAARTVVCTAPSKTFNLAGMQTSNIVITDPVLRETYNDERTRTGFFTLNALGFEACRLAYTEAEPWLEHLIELVASNHALVRAFMAERMPEVTVFDLEGTYLQWMDFRAFGHDAEELKRINEQEAHVFFDEGSIFGPEGEGFERMNLAAPAHAITAALERLAAAYGR
ncbi:MULTISPECIES: MalY/PatB family protein [unclassified Microbacterium]|uniref:MalY/PatB family protein n=1 Tax=unclassified Microbacterium TaxID=2609290 RepID=UPI0012F787A1|nr:MalY/PatB family protein [Microbacterium sp. MAH-37]MVQ43941.1 putative C-S lyase [Microbacterium sp. MAH-37]